MFEYCYLIATPGVILNSFCVIKGEKYLYFKFGDSHDKHEDSENIRKQYMTHNPDIGVFALYKNESTFNSLGKEFEKVLQEKKVGHVSNSEWYYAHPDNVYKLFSKIGNTKMVTINDEKLKIFCNKIRECF